ncbi:VirB3 family type IV secretion system protein [Aquincola sp. S2]|uniref:VirB3 family type IV secretion system protein n=1 Tax=Pseudaquabacterium terrae TaxID=2732868 RepID=A0ABX2ERU9_9BURK|nr:VirB3 family type IV secretion system protein [Aquabacterium terrae]
MMREAIYKGATRPAMKAGVPLIPIVVVLMPIALVTLWVGSLVSPWAFLVGVSLDGAVYLWMRSVTARDDQRLTQWFKALKLNHLNSNRRLFGLRSYSAYRARGANDVWRR